MKRRVGLSPGSKPLRRKSRLKPVNWERLARLRAKQYGAKAAWVAGLACCACGWPAPSDPAHVRARGPNPTNETLLPLCKSNAETGRLGCHDRQHARGWTALGAPRAHWLVVAASLHAKWIDERDAEERSA